jgi:hypothetical protein
MTAFFTPRWYQSFCSRGISGAASARSEKIGFTERALFPLSLRRVRTTGFATRRSCPLPEQTPFSLVPPQDNAAQLIGEFKNTEAMIFGEAPSFNTILASIGALEEQLNRP